MADTQLLITAERVLLSLEKELVDRIGVAKETNEPPGMSAAVGRLTFIDAYQQHQMDLHAQRQMMEQLHSVRAALERVKSGKYGRCMKCGEAIASERLEYLPDTPFCTPCNSKSGA